MEDRSQHHLYPLGRDQCLSEMWHLGCNLWTARAWHLICVMYVCTFNYSTLVCSIAIISTTICVYVLVFAYSECVGVCMHVRAEGRCSVAFLTGAFPALTLLQAETEMDNHAAVEGPGCSWLSPSCVHHHRTNTTALKDTQRKSLLRCRGSF